MATEHTQYTGTPDTEYDVALKRSQADKVAQDAAIAAWNAAEAGNLAANKDYVMSQFAGNLAKAQADVGNVYNRQVSEINPQTATAQALLRSGYQNSMGSANQSAADARAAALQQWQMDQADLASRYGQMGYSNLQNMYSRANNDMWNQYNSAITKDSDFWNRSNTETQQGREQSNLDREHAFAREQWLKDVELQQAELDLKKAAASRGRSGGGSGGGSGSGGAYVIATNGMGGGGNQQVYEVVYSDGTTKVMNNAPKIGSTK